MTILDDVKNLNVANAAIVSVSDIVFSEDVRKYCEMNSCGKYGKNWACPPGVGSVSELREQAHKYKKGLLVQTVHPLKSSFDLRGMMSAKKGHEEVLRNVMQMAENKYGLNNTLILGAGHCDLCSECTNIIGEPCRFPEKALVSMEACGIDVMKLLKDYGVPYRHGTETVAYVGLILFCEKETTD
jgi:predicted metal-binding protein